MSNDVVNIKMSDTPNWCGRVERKSVVERVVKDEIWELAPAV